jgi:hypothetical protein
MMSSSGFSTDGKLVDLGSDDEEEEDTGFNIQ